MQVRRHKRRLQAAGHRVHDNAQRNQETSGVDVHTGQRVHSGRAAQNQHRRNDDVRQEAKEQEDLVSGGAPSGVDDLTNRVRVRRIPLHLNRQDAKQKHLDGGTGRVPKRTGNTILIGNVRGLQQSRGPRPLRNDNRRGQTRLHGTTGGVEKFRRDVRPVESFVQVDQESGDQRETNPEAEDDAVTGTFGKSRVAAEKPIVLYVLYEEKRRELWG